MNYRKINSYLAMFGVQLEKKKKQVLRGECLLDFIFFFFSNDSVLELHLERADFKAVSHLFKSSWW